MSESSPARSSESPPRSERELAWDCYRRGLWATRNLCLFAFVFGVLFGTAAVSRGIPAGWAFLMSITVFAGSAQFAALEIWGEPLPLIALAVTTASVCSRHVLMGLTLPPLFAPQTRQTPFASLFFLTDVNWLLTTKANDVPHRLAFFLGSSTAMYLAWFTGSLVGLVVPQLLDPTTIEGTRSTGPIFIALIVVMLSKGFRGSRIPWLTSAVASGLISLYSIKIAVLTGVAVGTLTAALLTGEEHGEAAGDADA